jgi:hypothetical protein
VALHERLRGCADGRAPTRSRHRRSVRIQGNGDAEVERPADDYAENLGFMIMRLRRKYGCVPFVIDRLHPGTMYDHGENVRAEQDQVALSMDDVAVVDTLDLTLRDVPPVHYSAESFIVLGERMADAMLSCQ